MTYPKPMTFFIDLDGTVFTHEGVGQWEQTTAQQIDLTGAKRAIDELLKYGHHVVLTTGRREQHRAATVQQLSNWGISYDQLVMGLPPGPRVIVNDRKPDGSVTAHAVSHERNTLGWVAPCLGLGRGQGAEVP